MNSLLSLREDRVKSKAIYNPQPRKFPLFTSITAILFLWTVMLLPGKSYAGTPSGTNSSPTDRSFATDPPHVTARFANPQFDCTTEEYCLDVEFQCDVPNMRLSIMNLRFWYPDVQLEFTAIRNFENGYSGINPNPPTRTTSGPLGPAWFNFVGAAELISGGVQLTNPGAPPIYMPTSGFVKLYQVCFTVSDPNADVNNFCPPVVWDLEANPANGGFIPGNDGVAIGVMDPTGTASTAFEHVNQFNWEYIGSGAAPYGQPVAQTCKSIVCGPTLTCPANTTVSCGSPTTPDATGFPVYVADCSTGNPTITYTDTQSGGPCPAGYVIQRTWQSTDNCGNSRSCQQYITVNAPPGGGGGPMVTNTNDSGPGSLRDVIANAESGDTVHFSSSLAGQTILITSGRIVINENLYLHFNQEPNVNILSEISGLFEITTGKTVEFKDINIISGLPVTENGGAAFNNYGILKFFDVKVLKHPDLPSDQYLIRNRPGSQIFLFGDCFLEAS